MELKQEIDDTKGLFQLVQLTPEQINEDWEAISEGISAALPPITDEEDPGRMDKILSSLMEGRLRCWLFSISEEPYVLMTFTVTTDNMTGTKNLCLYSLYGYEPISYRIWNFLLREVRGFAKGLGCKRIIAYSSLPRVVELAKVLGGDASYHLITLEV